MSNTLLTNQKLKYGGRSHFPPIESGFAKPTEDCMTCSKPSSIPKNDKCQSICGKREKRSKREPDITVIVSKNIVILHNCNMSLPEAKSIIRMSGMNIDSIKSKISY